MPDTPTPGQIACAAFMHAMVPETPQHTALAWRLVETKERAAWEAAAEAVLATTPTLTDTPITDQLKDILRLVGRMLHQGTQQDLETLHLWLADYAEVVTARREAAAQAVLARREQQEERP